VPAATGLVENENKTKARRAAKPRRGITSDFVFMKGFSSKDTPERVS
jgi:hypothetical protein